MLSENVDHMAYQQRVNKELGNTRRFGDKFKFVQDKKGIERINMQV